MLLKNYAKCDIYLVIGVFYISNGMMRRTFYTINLINWEIHFILNLSQLITFIRRTNLPFRKN